VLEDFVHQAIDFIKLHQAWAGPVVGLLAFGESLVLIGVLIPGTAALVIVGGLVGAGILSPLPVIVGAALGAAVGDVVSYVLGLWLGRRFIYRWPLNRYIDQFARARLFFRRYGFATIMIGRFFGPLRSSVPLVAGMMGMNWRPFQLANVLSAIIWAPVVLSPGWLVARQAEKAIAVGEADWIGYAVVLALAVVVIAYVGTKMMQGGRRKRRPKGLAADVDAGPSP
jgi:membrane protein DedA with SNARE-associated domain